MDSELSDACLKAIQKASKPMSLTEIGAACLGRSKPNAKLVEALKQLTGRAVIHEWPSYRRSQIFSNRPLRSAAEDAFVAALDEAPLTIAKAAKPVSQANSLLISTINLDFLDDLKSGSHDADFQRISKDQFDLQPLDLNLGRQLVNARLALVPSRDGSERCKSRQHQICALSAMRGLEFRPRPGRHSNG
jgi:hypothetical protein